MKSTYARVATEAACTVINNCVIGQSSTDGTLIAALAASGNPSQTTQNVKITFINFDFPKKRIQIAVRGRQACKFTCLLTNRTRPEL